MLLIHPNPPSFCQPPPKPGESRTCPGFNMAASASFLVYYLSLCLLTRGSVSAPVTAFSTVQNLTTNSLSLHPLVSPLDNISLLNVTSPPDIGVRYLVPNTYVILK